MTTNVCAIFGKHVYNIFKVKYVLNDINDDHIVINKLKEEYGIDFVEAKAYNNNGISFIFYKNDTDERDINLIIEAIDII